MGVSSTTVSRWARSLAGGGDLKATKTPGRPVRLKRELIVHAYNEHGGPMTVFAFTDLLQERFGVTYDPVHLGRLMTRLGLAKKYPRATKAMRAIMGAKI
jgi:transposase